jgi:hypothetical protein
MTTPVLRDLIAAHPTLRASVRHDVGATGADRSDVPPGVSSGFAAIDRYLPWQGWPKRGMTELMTEGTGRGELSLLLPAMAQRSKDKRQIVCIGAPHAMFAPGLEQAGIDPLRVNQLPIQGSSQTGTRGQLDALWSAEQTLKSGTAGMLLLWTRHCPPDALRRLQLAALDHDTVMIHFRERESMTHASPAWVRMALTADAQTLRLQVLKCRGHLMTRPLITLDRAQVQTKVYAQIAANRVLDQVTRFGVHPLAGVTSVGNPSSTVASSPEQRSPLIQGA